MRAVALCFLLVFSCGAESAVANPHERIASSLIVIRAEGKDKTGRTLEAYGTGFIISTGGFAVSADHVKTDLMKEGVPESDIKLFARYQDVTASEQEVKEAGSGADDIIILKLNRRASGYSPVKLMCTFGESHASGPVYTSGFHNACIEYNSSKICIKSQVVYTSSSGEITSSDAIEFNRWATSLSFSGGNSGSPVYREDGTVIGVAKGTLRSGDRINYFTPITFARSRIGNLPIQSACSAVRDAVESVVRSDCIAENLASTTKRSFEIKDSVRAPGTGPQTTSRVEWKDVCYQAPNGWAIDGQVEVIRGEPNGGRGSISAVTYQDAPNSGRTTRACVTIKAWSQDQPFGAGGWQGVTLRGQIIKPVPDEQDIQVAATQCKVQR
ncbi:MAG: trypsin-like peptidase domain-containing protein [Devosia sp.]|uniref:S1 family peptidase n=1 Tax=Devosia sp. TaxID=1871048 RepID=UPI001AD229AA|nr:serine protease [Devosia sp.]MBN9314175.1 trypsin-like peptidase domain-containing protein [Devosia sp.]